MKQFIKNFNNLAKRTIFKVKNKTNDNFNISNFNKYLIIIVASLFIYLFYLMIPLLYDKTWIQANIESKLLQEFKINLSTSADISYRILPAPHFLIKDSKIFVSDDGKQKSIAEIKNFRMFLNQGNFLEKKKMTIKKIIINNANFSLSRNDLKLLSKYKSKKFSNKKIRINNSNIFFKDNFGDIISIIKIDKTSLFFDDAKLSNFLNLKGEIFNIPFTFDFNNSFNSSKYNIINLKSKLLKLDIYNRSIKEKKITSGDNNITLGENNISFLKSTLNTQYNIEKKIIIFKSQKSKLGNSQISYKGELSINPFNLNFDIYLDNYKISKLFKINPILIEFIQSRLLFNDNISINSSTFINSNIANKIFNSVKINFNIMDGKINFNKTKFVNDKIGSLKLSNSNLFFKNNELIFKSDILMYIKNCKNLFSFFNTSKSSRKCFETVLINFEYDFLSNKIKFNDLKIDNNHDINGSFLKIIDGFSDNDRNNLIKSRRLFNELFKAYAG